MNNINTMIDRAGEILEYLYKIQGAVGVSKLANDLDLPKATAFRILVTLEKWHIVEKNYHTDQYKLGMALIKYGAKVSSNLSLVEISKPIIDDLSSELEEGVYLNIEHQNYSLNIYNKTSARSSLMTSLIPLSALNCSASGKIFLTKRSNDDLKTYFNSDLFEKRTINSILTYEAYKKHTLTYEVSQCMFDDEEYEYGLFCIALPIIYNDDIVGTISVTGPKTRLEVKGIKTIQDKLKLAVDAITNLVQFVAPEKLYHY